MIKQIIGVISDTHGLLREEVYSIFKDCSLIIHAGDIGNPQILKELNTLAPIVAVRGNVDKGEWALGIPLTQDVKVERVNIHILHNIRELKFDPKNNKYDIIISGHSHKAKIEKLDGVLYLNPGSAGPRRFNLPITVGLIEIDNEQFNAKIVELNNYTEE